MQDIRYSSNDSFTKIVIECQDKIFFEKNLLKFPTRLYFDLLNTSPASFLKKEVSIDDPGIESVKVGQYNLTTTRVVLKLRSYDDFNVYTLNDPPRLVIEINYPNKMEEFIPRKRVVIIDPGHGGKDPGAIGGRGLREKDVVLDLAKRVKKLLETKYAVQVYLTRSTDRFLELNDRAAFANRKNADLFISIHANASTKRKVKGIETWFLNFTNNKEYQRVAARENAISLEEQSEAETIKDQILTSLGSDLKRDSSIRLANYIQNSMVDYLGAKYKRRVADLGVKFARFYVLHTDMPAALIEVGYITNREEERMLRTGSYRKDISYSIAKGIHTFLSTMPGMPKLALR